MSENGHIHISYRANTSALHSEPYQHSNVVNIHGMTRHLIDFFRLIVVLFHAILPSSWQIHNANLETWAKQSGSVRA